VRKKGQKRRIKKRTDNGFIEVIVFLGKKIGVEIEKWK
jgi:hypothetical protein